LALAALLLIIVLMGGALAYVFVTSNARLSSDDNSLSSLNGQLSSLQVSVSSLNQLVPDSTLMTVHYVLNISATLFGNTVSITNRVNSTIGLPYRAGHNLTLYLGGNSVTSVSAHLNGSILYTKIVANTSGFTIERVNPSLPLNFSLSAAPLITLTLSTPQTPYSGDVQIVVQVNYYFSLGNFTT